MKKFFIGLAVLVVVILVGIGVSGVVGGKSSVDIVHGAVGGGKENFLKDVDIRNILKEKYNLDLIEDNKSNNAMVRDKLVYTDEKGVEKDYDFVFFSDERFYEYYKSPAKDEEAPRIKSLDSSVVLNTPIVIYSWDEVCDALIKEKIVSQKDGIYYIDDMQKLIDYIVEGKSWGDIGLSNIYGKINITSPNPVTSSPGTTYYGLLASVMNQGYVDENHLAGIAPELRDFYKYSGFMNSAPADIFDQYLRQGMGAKPLIVDYEKSMIDFANRNPEGYNQVKDKIRILYPSPTIWNSHCLISFNELGNRYLKALEDPEIQKIAWQKYGFRTGLTGGQYNVSDIIVEGIPQEITSVTQGLKKEVYDEIIAILSE